VDLRGLNHLGNKLAMHFPITFVRVANLCPLEELL
ncbi:MAG: hypothetical protein JWP80_3816, partial [Pseudomonas sp.]|nr:hypothetical protein [Pseudomonas sp.]